MPLPPALLNRLKKRGIIKPAENQEEIIAESYDTSEDPDRVVTTDGSVYLASGAPGCPNKYNPFHLCCPYCYDHWGDGHNESRLDPVYLKRRARMLKKWPLPIYWKEVYDAGTGRYYYWNTETDEVCWLSPTHPRAKPGPAACKLAKFAWEKINKMRQDTGRNKSTGRESSRKRRDSYSEGSESESGDNDRRSKSSRRPGSGKSGKGDLDPMDPAAYSDVPRGKWSSGLENYTDAKTGVDTTASGPLFQQRPYPAPGAILRQNMEIAKKRKRQD